MSIIFYQKHFFKFSLLKEILLTFALSYCSICLVLSGQSNPCRSHTIPGHPGQSYPCWSHLVVSHPSPSHSGRSHSGLSHPSPSHSSRSHSGWSHSGRSHSGRSHQGWKTSQLQNSLYFYIHYGSTGCGVFKRGIQNEKDFCIKINIPKRKLLTFENWTNGEPQQLEKNQSF